MGNKTTYFNVLHDPNARVKCDYCELVLLPAAYLKHLTEGHQDMMKRYPPRVCVWCMSYTRKRGDKTIDHFAHRLPCLEHRILKDLVSVIRQTLAGAIATSYERKKIIREKECEMEKQQEEILGLRQALKGVNEKLEEGAQIMKQKDYQIREQKAELFWLTDIGLNEKWRKKPFNYYKMSS